MPLAASTQGRSIWECGRITRFQLVLPLGRLKQQSNSEQAAPWDGTRNREIPRIWLPLLADGTCLACTKKDATSSVMNTDGILPRRIMLVSFGLQRVWRSRVQKQTRVPWYGFRVAKKQLRTFRKMVGPLWQKEVSRGMVALDDHEKACAESRLSPRGTLLGQAVT